MLKRWCSIKEIEVYLLCEILISIYRKKCSAVCSLQSAVCGLWSAVCSLQSAVCSLQSAVCSLRSAVCSLRSAVCSLQSAVCSLHFHPTGLFIRLFIDHVSTKYKLFFELFKFDTHRTYRFKWQIDVCLSSSTKLTFHGNFHVL